MKTWEIVLSSSYHPDIFVIIDLPDNATNEEMLETAIKEATSRTYLFSAKCQSQKT